MDYLEHWEIKWIDRNRDATQPPNPAYPNGQHADITDGATQVCHGKLPPTPPKRCGCLHVVCQRCGYSAMLTTAGKPDDPVSLKMACKIRPTLPETMRRLS